MWMTQRSTAYVGAKDSRWLADILLLSPAEILKVMLKLLLNYPGRVKKFTGRERQS